MHVGRTLVVSENFVPGVSLRNLLPKREDARRACTRSGFRAARLPPVRRLPGPSFRPSPARPGVRREAGAGTPCRVWPMARTRCSAVRREAGGGADTVSRRNGWPMPGLRLHLCAGNYNVVAENDISPGFAGRIYVQKTIVLAENYIFPGFAGHIYVPETIVLAENYIFPGFAGRIYVQKTICICGKLYSPRIYAFVYVPEASGRCQNTILP